MGRLEIVRNFASPPEGCMRTLRVWLPDAYDREPVRRFPVVYMHDGQNLFDSPDSAVRVSWGVDRALEGLLGRGAIEPWIVVAIDHRGADRLSDLAPWDEPRVGVAGRAERYGAFVVEHLKPEVDRALRTRGGPEWTATVGSSMGGLVSLFLALRWPQVFGRVGALSPSVTWAQGRLFRDWNCSPAGGLPRIYLDAGADERFQACDFEWHYGAAAADFAGHLRGLGFRERDLKVVLEPGGRHEEADWRRRLPAALEWLLSSTLGPG